MNDYSPYPSQSIQSTQSAVSIQDPDETETKNNSQSMNPQSTINTKLEHLNISINGHNYTNNTNPNPPHNINNNNNNNNNNCNGSPYFLHQNNKNTPNDHETLIKNNKTNNVILFTDLLPTLHQTKSPETPRRGSKTIKPEQQQQEAPQRSHSDPQITTNNKKNRLLIPNDNTNNPSSMSLNSDYKTDINDSTTFNGTSFNFEPPSRCTNDPGAPIISLERAKREFKTVSQAAFRFQFVCDTYRRCKKGTVKDKDFAKLEDVINYVHDQLLRRRLRNSSNTIGPSKSPIPPSLHNRNKLENGYPNIDELRPSLSPITTPICSVCNKSFPSSHCYTTCNHPLCIKCLVSTFNRQPKNPRWYLCPMNGCQAMLPPQSHFLILSYKPSRPPSNTSNNLENENTKNKILYKRMLNEYIKVRNISYKNMLKIVGEYFSSKLKYYDRWRKCENCDFGFLADPDVAWHQVFELKCVVCNIIQRVQLLGPEPCNKLSIKKSYYPNDNMFKTVIFIRHGEAQNNVGPNDPNLRDPNLTNRGKEQCKHLNQYFGSILNIQCILSSSMNRCLQTAIIGIYNKEKQKTVPFIALECLRERLSPLFNRRETITVKKEKYNAFGIDFTECKCDDDIYYDQEKKNEKYEDMNKRAWQFYKYLLKRNEQTIAIVSHEGMLQCLTNIIDSNDKCLRRSFKNAEARLCFMTLRK